MDDITLVEIELAQYRKGQVMVQFDLRHGLLRWRESNRWNRNFTRSLSSGDITRVKRMLEDCDVYSWQPYYPDRESVVNTSFYHQGWSLSIYTEDTDPELHIEGKDAYPPQFPQLTNTITVLIRQPFKVLD